jgi:hypothetical protein
MIFPDYFFHGFKPVSALTSAGDLKSKTKIFISFNASVKQQFSSILSPKTMTLVTPPGSLNGRQYAKFATAHPEMAGRPVDFFAAGMSQSTVFCFDPACFYPA